MFHIDVCSLSKNFDDSEYLLKTIYVANYLLYKPRTFKFTKKKRELESTFIGIINPKKSNIIVGCI